MARSSYISPKTPSLRNHNWSFRIFAATLLIYPGNVPCVRTLTICHAVALIHSRGRSRFDNWGPLQLLANLLSDLTRGIHNIAICRKKGIWSEKKPSTKLSTLLVRLRASDTVDPCLRLCSGLVYATGAVL
jgi:hypothetical protein